MQLAHASCHDGLLFVRFLRDTKVKLKKKTWEQKKRGDREDKEEREASERGEAMLPDGKI